jgi:hypothetical protein
MQEEHLALLLSHELAHYLLEHQPLRLAKDFLVNDLYRRLFRFKPGYTELHDPIKDEFRAKVSNKQRHSCFYP